MKEKGENGRAKFIFLLVKSRANKTRKQATAFLEVLHENILLLNQYELSSYLNKNRNWRTIYDNFILILVGSILNEPL